MKKLTKLLTVVAATVALGTGIAGAVGCGEDPKPEHKHDDYLVYVIDENDATKHYQHCTEDDYRTESEAHTWGSDNKCTKCDATKPQDPPVKTKYKIPAQATALVVEGYGDASVELSDSKKSHSIDKSAIKVYFNDGEAQAKKTEVPADNLEIGLVDASNAPVASWEGLKQDGAYKITVKLKDCEFSEGAPAGLVSAGIAAFNTNVTIEVHNAIKTDSLAVKSGATLTQGKSVQDRMTSTWTFEVSRANGDKEDVPASEVTVSGIETLTVTSEATATLKYGDIASGTVKYSITANADLKVQTYAVNFGSMNTGTVAEETAAPAEGEDTTPAATLIDSAGDGSGTLLTVRGLKVEANSNNAAKECGVKYFPNRAPFLGATFASTGALQSKRRYFTLKTEGVARLTIYWSRNSSADERGVAVWKKADFEAEGFAFTAATPVGSDKVVNTADAKDQSIHKLEINLMEAGEYYITSLNNQNVYFYYIQLDTEFEDANKENIELGGQLVAKELSLDATAETVKHIYKVGDELDKTGLVAKLIKVNEVSADREVTALAIADIEFTVSDGGLASMGKKTVTLSYTPEGADKALTAKYEITVESAVDGVYGITPNVKSTVNPVLENADAKLTLNKSDLEASIVGANDNATVTVTKVEYKRKGGAAGSEAEITDSVQLGLGTYEITVTAKVADATNEAVISASLELKVKIAKAYASWLYQEEEGAPSADNNGIAKNATIDNNGSFTAVALMDMSAGASKDGFAAGISKAGKEPKAAADKTASGEEITFTNALFFKDKAPTAGKDYLKITAKKDTTIYIYLNTSDDKHNSDKTGAVISYKVNGVACEAANEVTTVERASVSVLKVTLKANDELVVSVKASDLRVWFYGIEAVDAQA